MADNSQAQNLSYKAGEANAHAQANTDQIMDKASNAANSAKESCQEVGGQIKAKAKGAMESAKSAVGMNK